MHSTCQPTSVFVVFLTLTEKHPSASTKPVINHGLNLTDFLLKEYLQESVVENNLEDEYFFTLILLSQPETECTMILTIIIIID